MNRNERHQVARALRAAAAALSASEQEAVAEHYGRALGELREQIENAAGLGVDLKTWRSANLWLAWRNFYRAGEEWGEYVIDNLAIPPKQAKAIEMAVRLFQKRYGRGKGPRPGIIPWYDKNEKRFEVLVDAADWPERSEDDGIFQHGPFTVHNTIGASEKDLDLARKTIDLALRAMPRAELPGFKEMAYGHIYLVGEVGRKNWAAWYMEDKDFIYLRPKIRGKKVQDNAKTLIHELGHRYWRKKLSRETKQEWKIHHQRMLDQPGEETLPEVGEVLDNAKVNNKTPKVVAYEPEGVLLHNARNDKPIGHMPLWQFKRFMSEINATGKFPSIYAAKGGYEEHFCEALSFKAMGDLDPANIAAFDRVILDQDVKVAARVEPEVKYRGRFSGPHYSPVYKLLVYEGGKKVGGILLIEGLSPYSRQRVPCPEDVKALIAQGADEKANIWVVDGAFLDEHLHNKGIGKEMYRRAFKAIAKKKGPVFFVPSYCELGSGTSQDARRVWKSLSREYKSSGDVFYVRPR